MNFLAHIYLSRDDKLLGLSNLAADKIKGKQYLQYPKKVQQGVLLHRKIDSLTDSSPIVYKATQILFPSYRHFSKVIIDMYFDHFLSNNWEKYDQQKLHVFTENFSDYALANKTLFPPNIQRFIERLVQHQWLNKYRDLDDLKLILLQMETQQ